MTHSISYRRILNKMDYYNYQNGLITNHLNQEGRWDSHIDHCRNFIMKAIDLFKPEKITVLGSGWLLDLPVAEMIESTKEICLVDIIHPPEVKNQAGNLRNVELSEQDITGGLIDEIWRKAGKFSLFNRLKSLDEIIIPEYKPEGDPGFVISLNILTQLESLPVTFLKKRSKIREVEFDRFRAEIQKKHIDFLKKHQSVLITDYAEVITRKSGSIETIATLLTELPQGRLRNEWIWNFDIKGADNFTSTSVIKVVALAF
jgi:hypothetical protein